MHNYYFKIEVTGKGRFPLDQLRRFELFPIDLETVAAIEASIEGPSESRVYTLGMNGLSMGADIACEERFASFGFHSTTLEVWRPDGSKFYDRADELAAQSA